jgi:hypothetical protein
MHQYYPIVGHKKESYAYNFPLELLGVPLLLIDWCRAHCQDNCGWWFKDSDCYMGFDGEQDFVMFSMRLESVLYG